MGIVFIRYKQIISGDMFENNEQCECRTRC